MNRVSSERADAASSGSKAAPVMSSRYVCPPDPARLILPRGRPKTQAPQKQCLNPWPGSW
eukprot:6622562-Alexandrium_andersonii.AAC.1